MIFLSFKQLNSTHGIIFSCWSYGIYPNYVSKSQRCAKSCDLCKKQITCFSLKTKCCRVIRMSSQNKLCSQDNLERVIEMQHCNHKHGSIHSSIQCYRPSDRVRGCGTAQFGLTRTITHNRQNPAQYWKISWKFKLNQVFLLISKISRKLLGYLPSKTNEKSIAFSSNSSGAYKNNKALSIARAVLGTST